MLINIEKVIVIFKIQLKLRNFCNKKYKSNYYKTYKKYVTIFQIYVFDILSRANILLSVLNNIFNIAYYMATKEKLFICH